MPTKCEKIIGKIHVITTSNCGNRAAGANFQNQELGSLPLAPIHPLRETNLQAEVSLFDEEIISNLLVLRCIRVPVLVSKEKNVWTGDRSAPYNSL
jgi:hypothetical protein